MSERTGVVVAVPAPAARWATSSASAAQLSHDLPCPSCGHGIHTVLPCRDDCRCPPVVLPGQAA